MVNPLDAVAYAAADLKIAAPQQYTKLLAAFQELEKSSMKTLCSSGPDAILVAQGRANAVSDVTRKLENCIELRNQHEKRA